MPLTVEQLNANLKRDLELWSARKDFDLDVRIAERSGDEKALQAAKAAKDQNGRDWYNLRVTNTRDVREWLVAAGFDDPTLVCNALKS